MGERERLKLMLSQVMDMVVTVMEDLMEVMVVTEAMEAMVMERERLRPNQDMDMAAMEDMVMGDLMEVMVDTEAMEVMVMEREMLSQVMDMVDMVMEDLMVVTEATDMVVTVMESRPTSKSKYDCSKYQLNLYMRIFFFLEINIQKH